MSKYGGSEKKQHKLLLQHITSRGSRLAPRHPLASSSVQWGWNLCPTSPSLPPPSVPESPAKLGDTGRTVLAGFYRTLDTPWGCTSLFCPNKLSSLCPLDPPVSRTRTACSFYGVHRLVCLSPANHRDRIRLFRGGYCLNNGLVMAACTHWSMALCGKRRCWLFPKWSIQNAERNLFALWSWGDGSRCYLY